MVELSDEDIDKSKRRLTLVCRTIERQKSYIARLSDPDNRYRADGNLQTLVAMRDELESALGIEISGR